MSTLQIIYETRYGQTRKIAESIAELARRRGHDVDLCAIADVDPRKLSVADASVVLAPVYLGKHPQATKNLAMLHGEVLNARPSAFVSVSGSAGSTRPKDRENARDVAVRFLATTPWRPNLISTAAGAIAYPKYGFFTRMLMKAISKREGVSTDTSRVHELTDWLAVEQLTTDLLSMARPKRGRAPLGSAPAPTTA